MTAAQALLNAYERELKSLGIPSAAGPTEKTKKRAREILVIQHAIRESGYLTIHGRPLMAQLALDLAVECSPDFG